MGCPLFLSYISVAPKLGLNIVTSGLLQKDLIPIVLLIEPPKALHCEHFKLPVPLKQRATVAYREADVARFNIT